MREIFPQRPRRQAVKSQPPVVMTGKPGTTRSSGSGKHQFFQSGQVSSSHADMSSGNLDCECVTHTKFVQYELAVCIRA